MHLVFYTTQAKVQFKFKSADYNQSCKMAPSNRFGPKQDEYNFFTKAFKIIDEERTETFIDALRAFVFEIFFNGRTSKCLPAYKKLASKASDRLVIVHWNEIPLWRIRKKGFAGYQEALEEIFRHLSLIYKESPSEPTRCRVDQLMKQAVAILKKRICEVERCGLAADARVTGNHLHVIELWSRCLKVAMEEISYEQEVQISEDEQEEDEDHPLIRQNRT